MQTTTPAVIARVDGQSTNRLYGRDRVLRLARSTTRPIMTVRPFLPTNRRPAGIGVK
jgi:hypothetical protein